MISLDSTVPHMYILSDKQIYLYIYVYVSQWYMIAYSNYHTKHHKNMKIPGQAIIPRLPTTRLNIT